jgi:hypothetical protein
MIMKFCNIHVIDIIVSYNYILLAKFYKEPLSGFQLPILQKDIATKIMLRHDTIKTESLKMNDKKKISAPHQNM